MPWLPPHSPSPMSVFLAKRDITSNTVLLAPPPRRNAAAATTATAPARCKCAVGSTGTYEESLSLVKRLQSKQSRSSCSSTVVPTRITHQTAVFRQRRRRRQSGDCVRYLCIYRKFARRWPLATRRQGPPQRLRSRNQQPTDAEVMQSQTKGAISPRIEATHMWHASSEQELRVNEDQDDHDVASSRWRATQPPRSQQSRLRVHLVAHLAMRASNQLPPATLPRCATSKWAML